MAVTLLTKYVSLYVNDLEAWEELAAMYLQVRKVYQGQLLPLACLWHHFSAPRQAGCCRRIEEPLHHPDLRACESIWHQRGTFACYSHALG